MNIDILGSCVTRDAFNFGGSFNLKRYYARTSIVSLYSKPLKIDISEINLPSEFQKKIVFFDLTNNFRKYMKKSDSDILIIDFIDERFSTLKYKNSYITNSNEFIKSNLNDKLQATKLGMEIKMELWKSNILKFIKEVTKNYKTIILHKASWKEKYYDRDGVLCDFVNQPIQEKNIELQFYYKEIEKQFKGLKMIQLDQYEASENHQWGLSPYHYEDDYYKSFLKELEKIVKGTDVK